MKAPRRWLHATVLGFVLAVLACSTTTFESTWRAPDAKPLQLTGRKVVGVFISKNTTVRHAAEDALAREITARGAQGVPSYSVLGDDEIRDQDRVKAKLEKLGYSGAVIMRIAGRETEYNYQPSVWAGPHYRRFGGYWGYGWGTAYDPGYLTVDKIVKVETLVYSLEQDMLVWAGVSRTVDPTKIDDFITELSKEVASQMAKDGLLKT